MEFLRKPEIEKRIEEKNVIGGTSHEIQAIVMEMAEALGFKSEKKGLFAEYSTRQLRPDYYLPIGESGVILEVERGKTTMNNMDLLDIWKCHICQRADYLFIMVPHSRPSANGTQLRHYHSVQQRLATFFTPQNHINVEVVFIYGY
ncbi:MAG: hypothetical protein KDD60_03885 [Bdellovibrionales bacterium]|nr:hypothetical protein [Bdellovibrionales bacterium]